MSSKSNFIYEKGIEGYEETNEPKSIFGMFQGFNAYLIIDISMLVSFKVKGDFFYLTLNKNNSLPTNMKIWGDAIIEVDYDIDGLLISLEGGHYVTKDIVNKIFKHTKDEL